MPLLSSIPLRSNVCPCTGIEPHLLALIERAWNQASSDAAACKPGRQSSQGCREEQHSGFEDIETSNISEPAAGKAFDRKDGSDCGPGDALSSSSEPPTSGQGHEQQQQRQRQEGGSENFQGLEDVLFGLANKPVCHAPLLALHDMDSD